MSSEAIERSTNKRVQLPLSFFSYLPLRVVQLLRNLPRVLSWCGFGDTALPPLRSRIIQKTIQTRADAAAYILSVFVFILDSVAASTAARQRVIQRFGAKFASSANHLYTDTNTFSAHIEFQNVTVIWSNFPARNDRYLRSAKVKSFMTALREKILYLL